MDSELRERLLDNFPLTEAELDLLLEFDTTQRQSTNSEREDDDWTKEIIAQKGLPLFSSMVIEVDEQDADLRRMLQWAMENVFLLGDFGNAAQSLPTFLEAAVSLLGRRGDSFVYSALFQAAAGPDSKTTVNGMAQLLNRLVTLEARFNKRNGRVQQNGKNNGNEKDQGDDTKQVTLVAPSNWIASLIAKAKENGGIGGGGSSPLLFSIWKLWITECAPCLSTLVPTVFHSLWFGPPSSNYTTTFRPGKPWTLNRQMIPHDWQTMASLPYMCQQEYAVPLAAMLPQGHDYLFGLYSSYEHGLAFPTLMKTLLGHSGPTIMLFGARVGDGPRQDHSDDVVFGYYTQSPWRANVGWHGNDSAGSTAVGSSSSSFTESNDNDAFLFSVHPTWQMFGRTYDNHSGNGLQLLQTKTTHKTALSLPYTGLAVGGTHPDKPRLHITESFERCCVMATDKPFVSGPPLQIPGSDEEQECVFFDVDWVDVYAVVDASEHKNGGETEHDETIRAQAVFDEYQAAGQRVLEYREGTRQKMAHVDKKQFLDVFMDSVVGTKLYMHRTQARGRASFCADDEGKGYYVEGKVPSPSASTNTDS